MNLKMKKYISVLMSSVVGISMIFLFNNCGEGFQTMQDAVEQSSTTDGTTTIPGTIPPPTMVTPQQYFTNSVLPLFRNKCMACHVTMPSMAQGPPATAAIYTYANAKNYALTGATNATNNTLYNKMLGLSHGGGIICPGDVKGSVSPCKEVKTWILMENPLLTDGMAGVTNYVTTLGQVRGWAIDPTAPTTAISVVVYVDGPVGTGTMVGTYTASGAGSGVENGHVYSFQLPANLLNGAPRPLYVYGKTAVAANILTNSPFTYTGFAGTTAGATQFTNNVVTKLNACMGCHSWATRELTIPYLVAPTPLNGGTATNNLFINKTNGQGHAGGGFCGGNKANEPCASITKWYRDEGIGP